MKNAASKAQFKFRHMLLPPGAASSQPPPTGSSANEILWPSDRWNFLKARGGIIFTEPFATALNESAGAEGRWLVGDAAERARGAKRSQENEPRGVLNACGAV